MRYFRIFAIVAVTALSAWSVSSSREGRPCPMGPVPGERLRAGAARRAASGWSLRQPWNPAGTSIRPPRRPAALSSPRFRFVQNPAISDVKIFRPQPVRKNDPNFQIDTETYSDKAVFLHSGGANGRRTYRTE